MYAFKKVIGCLIEPTTLSMLLVLLGLFLLVKTSGREGGPPAPRRAHRRFRVGLVLVLAGVIIQYLASIEIVSRSLCLTLEKQFSPLAEDATGKVTLPAPPQHIVLLAAGANAAEGRPGLSSTFGTVTDRVLGASALWHQFPNAELILTGTPKETLSMKTVLLRLGVDPQKIFEENESRDTKDHALYLESRLKGRTFLLTTSATHMPRAMGLFRQRGLNPIAAPVNFLAWPRHESSEQPKLRHFRPKPVNTSHTSKALHEIIGIAWAKWRGQYSSTAPE